MQTIRESSSWQVVQGLLQASRNYYDSKESMLQLWCHECFRVFGDRMWDKGDKAWLQNQLNSRLLAAFSTDWKALHGDGPMQPFVSFMRPVENPPYEPVADFPALKELLQTKMEDYGLEPGAKQMDLVLFRDALEHVCRIHRVLMQPRGNALLVGVGGSGRKSLAKLAAYVAELKVSIPWKKL
jgi:dynein heavy chain